jgi:hypothetical protein
MNDTNLNSLLEEVTSENLNEELLKDYPAKVTVCRCRQCRAKKKKMRDRKAVRLFKRHTNKKRRTITGKHIHHTWA